MGTSLEITGPSSSRGDLAQAREALARGRHKEALDALRKAKRRRGARAPELALQEADALLGLLRHRDALDVATRALRRRPTDDDVAARLRILRGQALWLMGRRRPGCAEVRKAAGQARALLTRARAEETLGSFAWRAQDHAEARARLATARGLYDEAGSAAGLVRVLENEGALLRDAGRIEEALEVHARRIDAAARTTRIDALARARNDRGDLLAVVGRWTEAREELDRAAQLFHEVADPREFTLAGVNRGVLALAAGDLGTARAAVRAAHAALGDEPDDPAALGEVLLLTADLHLALGETEPAERAGGAALGAFTLAGDADGECRSRVRRAQALVGLGRICDAAREARRARRAAGPTRKDLAALAALVLGRALLGGRRREAMEAFDNALTQADGRSGLAHAARLGRALARGAPWDDEEIRHCVAGLEMWGDRRLLSLCLAAVREIRGSAPVKGATPSAPGPVVAVGEPAPFVGAALALAGEGEWPTRWARAMRLLEPVLPWWRAAIVGGASWELRQDADGPAPLAPADLAHELAAVATGPGVFDLVRDPAWREHPFRVLHGLSSAAVVPAGAVGVLYLERREGRPALSESEVDLALQFGRLLACHWPPPHAEEGPPARFPEIVGRCPAMQSLFEQMARVAPSDMSVHVFGETGTGKERVAQALHRHSPRSGRPFVAVNASSLGDDLFDAEMFGHVRGAFTGAVGDRQGHVAAAEGGSLFIDEVADLSLRAQAKLLRFLSEGEYRRVGESETRRADVRIVTAANLPLAQRVAEGRFREDLVYRLGHITLTLPPLRERGEDLLMLARHFLKEGARRAGLTPPGMPHDITRSLLSHHWPGNVRELQAEMNRLLVLAGSGPIRPEDLSARVVGSRREARSSLREARAAFERDYIRRALEQRQGNRARTALALGLTRQALVAKIRKLGI